MVYIDNALMGALSLPFIAIALTLPYLVYQYARFGAVSLRKTVMVLVFLFYLICMFYQVILPLPADRSALVPYAQHPQMDPYGVWHDLKVAAASVGLGSSSGLRTWVMFLKQPDVYQAFFNVLLTIPFGFMLRYFFKRGILFALVAGFALTLFFETTQLTGLWGLYEHPYRLFDVCDLELNTLGSVVGSVLAIPLVYLLPDLDAANAHSIERGLARVSLTRRLVAFLIDAVLTFVGALGLYAAIHGIVGSESFAFDEYHLLPLLLDAVLSSFVFFMLVPTLTKGQTLGQKLVGLYIVCLDGRRPGFVNYLVRYGVLIWGCMLLPLVIGLLTPQTIEGISGENWIQTLNMVYGLWIASILVRGIVSFFGRPLVLLNGVMSNTTLGTKADPRMNRGGGSGRRASDAGSGLRVGYPVPTDSHLSESGRSGQTQVFRKMR